MRSKARGGYISDHGPLGGLLTGCMNRRRIPSDKIARSAIMEAIRVSSNPPTSARRFSVRSFSGLVFWVETGQLTNRPGEENVSQPNGRTARRPRPPGPPSVRWIPLEAGEPRVTASVQPPTVQPSTRRVQARHPGALRRPHVVGRLRSKLRFRKIGSVRKGWAPLRIYQREIRPSPKRSVRAIAALEPRD